MATPTETALHPLAPHYIPGWMPDATGADPFMTGMIIFVVVAVLGLGLFYLRLHALPEQWAHGTGASQLQIVSVLTLLALFTHNNMFWILALLIAGLNIPDFLSPLQSIARSIKRISLQDLSEPAPAVTAPVPAPPPTPTAAAAPAAPTSPQVEES